MDHDLVPPVCHSVLSVAIRTDDITNAMLVRQAVRPVVVALRTQPTTRLAVVTARAVGGVRR